MKSLQKQRGMGLLNLLVVVIVVAFCGIFAFKVIPLYADNRYIETALKDLAEPGAKFEQMSDSEIKKKMNDFYTVNNIRSQDAQNIVITRMADRALVTVDYEARANFFANIDIVVKFENHLDSTKPALCCTPLAEPKSAKY